MIELFGVSRHFGGVHAVDMLDLKVERGQIFGLIGPNGSGKSTTINLISGLFEPTSGRIHFAGRDISRLPMHRRVRCGMARTFQNIRLFEKLTVWENLWVAQNAVENRAAGSLGERWFDMPRYAREEIAQALEFAGLAHKRDQLAANLSFGEQRGLELARALASRPRLLLLDEPAAGMNPQEIDQLRDRIIGLRQKDITILLVEHVMDLIMSVCDRIAVLNFGRKIAEGAPSEIQADQQVRNAYLGDDPS